MQVRLILHPENRGWILEKFAVRLAENLNALGVAADISDRPSPAATINHWMLYLLCDPGAAGLSTMLITHVDHLSKYLKVRECLQTVRVGICLSQMTLEELARRGIDRRKLCYVLPGHDGLAKPRRLSIAITSRVYGDGRKREGFLARLADEMPLDPFHFEIVGGGWSEIAKKLQAAGATVNEWKESQNYEQDYQLVLERLQQCDYYLYVGMDEGSTGLLDALAAGLQTIVTKQGFHLDIEAGITHGFVEFDEFLDIFKQLTHERDVRRHGVEALTWRAYAQNHLKVWQALTDGWNGDFSSLLPDNLPRPTRDCPILATGADGRRGFFFEAGQTARPQVVRKVWRSLRLLILPEYDDATPHVVVDSVYGRLLSEFGDIVHMIRPVRGIAAVAEQRRGSRGGRLVGIPIERPGARLKAFARARRKRGFLQEALRLLRTEPIDAVLVRNDLISAEVAGRFAAQRSVPLVFQVSSPEAEFRINGVKNRLEFHRAADIVRGYSDLSCRRRICRRANVVLSISAAMRRHLIEVDRIPADKVFSFPMGAGSELDPTVSQVDAARRQLGLPWHQTLVYSGVIHPLRSPGFMLDVLDLVRRQVPDCGLLVITYQQDERRKAFEMEAADRNLPVRVVGPIAHSEISAYLKCAEVMLCPVPPRLEYAMSSPTKSLEALGVGIPVVGSAEIEEHQLMLQRVGGGIAAPFEIGAFADAVVRLLTDANERRTRGEAGRIWAVKYRGYPRLARYLQSILETVAEGRPLGELPHDPDEAEPDAALVTGVRAVREQT